ncbi:MAG: hypothetical protein H7Y42_16490 [Chitinophagaceae bacterium]|nr:hypothetical protein [Chitinophagaceae bacterium]
MTKKKIIVLAILVVVAIGAWYGYSEYNRKNKDMKHAKPDFIISATDLIAEFASNDSLAAAKYNGQVVEIGGRVKAVEEDDQGYFTVVIGDSTSLSSVRCALDTIHHSDAALLRAGSSTTLRGACTGFNKDEMGLGSDVIINRCALIKP